MNKVLLIIFAVLFNNSICSAQGKGLIKFPDTNIWMVQIDDSLYFSNQIVTLKPGIYILKARPQISYSWPSIYVEDTVTISAGDTVLYELENNIMITENMAGPQQLPAASDANNYAISNIREKSYLKEGIIIGALAGNWLSFYLKRVADSYYKDYRKASSSASVRKYKNKFQDFDLYSQITLGVSSALLTGYIYLTLTE